MIRSLFLSFLWIYDTKDRFLLRHHLHLSPSTAGSGRQQTMKSRTIAYSAPTLLLFFSTLVEAKLGTFGHVEHGLKHHHMHRDAHLSVMELEEGPMAKRGGQCQFPTDAGLVPVTPNAQNAGWAMSPDQPCKPDNYCPYACPPGQVGAQWDPKATSYTYPLSMVCVSTRRETCGVKVRWCLTVRHPRTVVSTATKVARSQSLSPTSPIALMEPALSRRKMKLVVTSLSARPSCLGVRPC